jgi:hypothetical protein
MHHLESHGMHLGGKTTRTLLSLMMFNDWYPLEGPIVFQILMDKCRLH